MQFWLAFPLVTRSCLLWAVSNNYTDNLWQVSEQRVTIINWDASSALVCQIPPHSRQGGTQRMQWAVAEYTLLGGRLRSSDIHVSCRRPKLGSMSGHLLWPVRVFRTRCQHHCIWWMIGCSLTKHICLIEAAVLGDLFVFMHPVYIFTIYSLTNTYITCRSFHSYSETSPLLAKNKQLCSI